MMCGMYVIAVYGLVNIYNLVSIINGFIMVGEIVAIIGIVVTLIVYLPEIAFYVFLVKYIMGGDTVKNRRGVVTGMKCLVANAFFGAIAVLLFGGIAAGVGGIILLAFMWIPLVIVGLLLTWWMMTTKDWYHELVKAENGGQIPADKRA